MKFKIRMLVPIKNKVPIYNFLRLRMVVNHS